MIKKRDNIKKPEKFRSRNDHKHSKKSEKTRFYEGIIKTNRKKTGYIDREGDLPSIYFPESNLKTALDGDSVQYSLTHKKDQKNGLPIGMIEKITNRFRDRIVGTVIKEGDQFFVSPDNNKIYTNILLKDLTNIKENTKVHVEFKWDDPKKKPEGFVIETLGLARDNNAEMRSIAIEKGFATAFPEEVEMEAENFRKNSKEIRPEEMAKRRDFRNILTFTVDPIDAKDFDDALSIQKLSNGHYEIGVHIADVSYFVKPRTELEREAQKRQFSVYLVDRTIPMLPEALSNDLCSLNPGEEKRAFSAVFEMDENGKVYKEWFGRTVIKSDKRFSYEEAQESIENKDAKYHTELTLLNFIAKKLRAEKEKNGAIDFESPEVKFVLDKNGKPLSVIKKERKDAHKLIEEYMLLANKEVAKFISNKTRGEHKDKSFLYRIHDAPKTERIGDLSVFLKALGYELEAKDGNVTNKQIQNLIKEIAGSPEEALIKTAVLRSMSKAIYTTKNIGHFGLGFEFYTHFTSPIRRYPDLLVHRILAEYLDGKKVSDREFDFFKKIGELATQKEISAAEAERASIKYKQVEYMSDFVGNQFNAVISGVTEWGIFVEEENTKSEGMIRMKDLGDDYFELNEKTFSVSGRKTKKTFSLGDKIKVKLSSADKVNNTLDFELVK